jgi:hypothetical protein
MARMKWGKELEHLASYVDRIGSNTGEIAGKTVYEMAAVVADKVRQEIDGMHYISDAEGLQRYVRGEKAELTYSEKKGLQDGFGISPMQNDSGFLNVRLGFDGYNDVKTRKYPNGQPNVMIARSIESGSPYRSKNPFMRRAINASKKAAIAKAEETAKKEIEKLKEK